MAFDQKSPFSLPNGNALTSSSMFHGVTIDASGNAALPSAGGTIVGVMYGISGDGGAISVRGIGDGIAKLAFGGSVTSGDNLKVDNTGKFVTASGGDTVVAQAAVSGSSGEVHHGVLVGAATNPTGGYQDAVLGTNAPSNLASVIFVETTGTATGALGDGFYPGQLIDIYQSVAASTPVGTITGHFANNLNVAKGTLALGTTVALIFRGVWTGTAWRQRDALGGSGSGLS